MITFLEESSMGHKSKLYPSPHRLSIAADRSLILVPDWRWIWRRRRRWCIEANPSSLSSIIIRSRQVTCLLLLLVTGIIQRSLLIYSFWVLVFLRERMVSGFYCSVLVAKVEDRKRTWLVDPIIMGFNLKTRRDERQEWCPRRAQVYYLNTCTKIEIFFTLKAPPPPSSFDLPSSSYSSHPLWILTCVPPWFWWEGSSGPFKDQKTRRMMDTIARSLSRSRGDERWVETGRHETRSRTKGNTGAAGLIWDGDLLIFVSCPHAF